MDKKEYYFKHDQSARHDLKIISMISDYGMQGYGMFWVLIEVLRSSKNYQIHDKEYNVSSLSYQMRVTPELLNKFIEDCVNKYELFIKGNGFFYSMRLRDDMEILDTMRENKVRAGRMGAESRWKHD